VNGAAPASTSWTATPAGTYYFQATYSGDSNNTGPVSSPCTSETLVVSAPNTVSVSTLLSTSSPVTVGAGVSDQASLAGETGTAGGTISYGVYSNSTCTTLVSNLTPTSNSVVNGAAPASTSWTATPAGTYYFQATYSGDSNNTGPVSSPCTSEQLVVNKATTSLSTTVVAVVVTSGSSISDTATLAGGVNPGGTITFSVYGPGNTCSSALKTGTVSVIGNGTYTSASYTPSGPGVYRWIASYSGDSNNSAAGPGVCTDPNEFTNVVGSGPGMTIVTSSTKMASTTTFSTANATVTCPAGTTLVGGGDELTNAGAPVSNDGSVTLDGYPSNSSGTMSPSGTHTPGSWTATGGYSSQAPGTDTITSYAMCVSNVTSATVVQVSASAANSLGPVTAVCPSTTSLVGGGGGYTSFPGSNNTKLYDSFPSNAAGTVPTNGTTGLTAWTVQGNSNNATGATTTAIALCATDVTVPTVVETATNMVSSPAAGAAAAATATCPAGTTLLDGGIDTTANGTSTATQGVHVIGDFPSDASGNPLNGTAQSWTATSENGGQALTSLATESLVLCGQAQPKVSTQLSKISPVTVGTAVSDQATLPGATTTAGGTISYGVYSNSTCTTQVSNLTPTTNTVANGVAPASMAWTATPAGTYYFQATYSGDAGNAGPVSSACTSEPLVVSASSTPADLSINKTVSPLILLSGVGGTLTYTLTVHNGGPGTATGVTVSDPLASTTTFASASSTQGSCVQASGTVSCSLGTLANGATATVTIKATATSGGFVTNTATVTGGQTDPNTKNNSDSATAYVVGPIVTIQKTGSPSPVGVNSTLTYTISVHNFGPGTATGMIVTDPLPATTTFVSDSSSQGSCSGTTTVTCSLGSLASGATATVTIKVTATKVGTITNTATASATDTDPLLGNASDSVTTKVVAPSLNLTKTGSPNPVKDGSTLTYTLTVHNNGPGTATGVTVTDPLPTGVTYSSASTSQGSCTQSAGTVTCAVGTLTNGSTATITIKVVPSKTGTITNTASATANETGSSPADTASATTKVTS
jgi:uncharacterized repeat protein (TIGR01451 family)